MVSVIHGPDVVFAVRPQSVGVAEEVPSPGAEIIALGVKDDEWVGLLPAVKDVDLALRIGCDRGDATELPAVRHRVRLFSEADGDAIFEQPPFVRGPAFRDVALLGRLRFWLLNPTNNQEKNER